MDFALWLDRSSLKYLLLLLFLFLGCNHSRYVKKVDGVVTYNGQAVENGTIVFIPIKGTQGGSTGAEIKAGRYAISENGILPGGTYRVEISALRPTGSKSSVPQGLVPLPSGKDSVSYEEMENYLPEKFNSKSQLTIEFSDSSESEQHDFNLE